jgi:hypothetical protein
LKPDILSVCENLGIDCNLLIMKQLEDFADANNNSIQEIRYHHYSRKRTKLLEIIENFLNSGTNNSGSAHGARIFKTTDNSNKFGLLGKTKKSQAPARLPSIGKMPDKVETMRKFRGSVDQAALSRDASSHELS